MDADVIVIGAGLAGLQAARRLQTAGNTVIVLEASDQVGGRMRTDHIDGYLCDRGFQVLNPAYPAVKQWADVKALGLQSFGVGAVVHTPTGDVTLADPRRHPGHLRAALRSGYVSARELAALSRWLGPTLLGVVGRAAAAHDPAQDESLRASLMNAGVTGRLRRDVLDTFLAGVIADSSGESSAAYVRDLVRYFALGTPGLPRDGMGALPQQLAANLVNPVRLSTPVRTLNDSGQGVRIDTDSGSLRARTAVVAVGPQHLGDLTPLPAHPTHGLTTWWFSAPGLETRHPFLILDATGATGGPAGPIWNTAVVSNAAPSYAPPGQNLVEVTTLLDQPTGLANEAEVRQNLERIYRTSTAQWQVLAHHVVPHTLPVQRPHAGVKGPEWVSDHVLVTGDHRQQGSINGAMVSGNRAGLEVAQRLTA